LEIYNWTLLKKYFFKIEETSLTVYCCLQINNTANYRIYFPTRTIYAKVFSKGCKLA
jgi:hypothetical protein